MRVLLAMLVGLAQVAGPWLCCCVTARAAVAAPAQPVEACPHCGTKVPPTEQAPSLPEPCPCGGKQVEPAPPAKPDLVAVDLPQPGFVPAPSGPVAPSPAPVAGVCDTPFLPPGTRLYVHHVLLC